VVSGDNLFEFELQRLVEAARAKGSSMVALKDLKSKKLVSLYGAVEVDKQGRVVLPQVVRDPAGMIGDVCVLGLQNHLGVWNAKRVQERFKREPFTEDDGRALAEFGI